MHVKTKNYAEEVMNDRGKLMAQSCDLAEKEERIKCVIDYRNENIIINGNLGISVEIMCIKINK